MFSVQLRRWRQVTPRNIQPPVIAPVTVAAILFVQMVSNIVLR